VEPADGCEYVIAAPDQLHPRNLRKQILPHIPDLLPNPGSAAEVKRLRVPGQSHDAAEDKKCVATCPAPPTTSELLGEFATAPHNLD